MATLANKIAGASEPAAPAVPAAGDLAASGAPAASVDGSVDYPCSVAQERFWLLDRLDPGNSAYNVAVRWRLEGKVATDLLEQAWLQIIERHEVLRSVFLEVNGAPVQRVMPHAPFRLHDIDLSALPTDKQQPEGDRIGVIEARAPFDLATGPLIRATLLRFSPTSAIILVTTHQVVSDGWSVGIMAREMGQFYDAAKTGIAANIEPLSIQYADYSQWQLEWLAARGTEAETAYWSRHLAGIKPFKVRPDHSRPAMPTTNGAIVSRLLPRQLTNRAQSMSAERGATLFAAALAGLCATLARFTGETEIVVGTQVSDRDQVELEPMIGQFVNSLILRNDLSGNPTFAAMLDAARETIAQALEHRHMPIERLLGMVKSERSDANVPPISVNFIFQKTFIQNEAHADFALTDLPSLPAGAIYDLNLFMVERPDGWRFSCQYNKDQFDGSTAERLLGYFERLLEDAVAAPTRRLSELALGSVQEVRALLSKLNDTRTLYPRELSLGQLFDAQVARAPEALALLCGERRWNYAELNGAADRLAAALLEQGVTPGAKVAVALARGGELPLALLAIIKAGATYVPLDPAAPAAHQALMLRLTGAVAVIGERLEAAAFGDATVRLIDVQSALAADSGAAPVTTTVAAETLACMVCVAGEEAWSAAGLTHRNLANVIYSLAKRPGIGERDVLVAASPPATGAAVLELLLPLLTGAALVVPQEHELAGGRAFLTLLQRAGATIVQAPAAVWAALLDAHWIGYPALKMLCCAAELPPRLLERLCGVGGELWSLYGRVELGVWVAAQRVKRPESAMDLGAPLANTALYVLEPALNLAPIGGVGQLYAGGDGATERALGAAVQIETGARVSRTGSLARLQPDGRIEYLGESDERIAHEGHLIHPRLIERLLEQQAGVAQAAVVPLGDVAGGQAFGAFVVPTPGASTSLAAELQSALAAALPPAFLPSSVMLREVLPRLADGTIDRRTLIAPRTARSGTAADRPAGEVELRLAALWESMLGVEAVGAHDHFFELGGHSLLAARMLTQVERQFGRRIKLATLFLAPTLHEFAQILEQATPREFDFRQVVKIQAHGSRRPLIAINNTGIYYSLAKHLGADQPVYSLQLFDPSLRDSPLPQTLEEIAAGYVELIRRVQPRGPYDLAGWCVAGALAFEIGRQLAVAGERVAHLFLVDSWVPNYFKRQSKLRGWIGNYSLRAQLILADWRRVLAGEQSAGAFLSQRSMYKRLRRLFSKDAADSPPAAAVATPETYDAWLLAYLQRVTAGYTPKTYEGKVTVLRSRLEPAGWFFRQDAGWGEFARDVEVKFVDGNHFTMFQDPGSEQMARHVAESLKAAAAG